MNIPVEITIKDLDIHRPDERAAVHRHIQEEASKLPHFYNGITRCHAVLEQTQKHQRQGKEYMLRLNIHVPGATLSVNEQHKRHNKNPYLAISNAFDALRRQLKDYVSKRRSHT